MERGVRMTARDGTQLVMDIYRPGVDGSALDGRFPVVVERTPYQRATSRIAEFARLAALSGYVFVSQDVRGRGSSGGHFHMLTNDPDEGQDGADTIAWIRRQPWYNGRIGTVGGSFSAANQQAMALHHPKGLCAQVLRDAGTNYYRRMLRYHGAFNVGMVLPWALNQAINGREAAADPNVSAALCGMRDNLGDWIAKLPLKRGASPLALAPEYEDIFFTMLEAADDGPYWQNPAARLEGRWDEYPTDVAILLVSGWFAHHAAANFDKLREFRRRSSRPVRLIIGPWIHGPTMIEATRAGEVDFGAQAALHGPINALWLDWLDRFVRSGEAMVTSGPALSYFAMGTGDGHRTADGLIAHGGEWREADDWPVPGTCPTPFYLHEGGHLSRDPPNAGVGPSQYDFDPNDPCPGIGATSLQSEDLPAFVLPGPRDQRCRPDFSACHGSDRPLAERSDVLVFETEPLHKAIEITGDLAAKLFVTSSARDTDFTARLIDVYPTSTEHPKGCSLLISEGILRMRYRDGRTKGELIEPHVHYAITIELGPTSNVFKCGHRIRIDISSSSFPQYDVNPNTGEPLGHHTKTEIARQSIFHDAERPSHIVLPLKVASKQI